MSVTVLLIKKTIWDVRCLDTKTNALAQQQKSTLASIFFELWRLLMKLCGIRVSSSIKGIFTVLTASIKAVWIDIKGMQ